MKKALFIGHEYHNKTLSNQFFIKLLKKKYNIDYCWTNPFRASIDIMNDKDILNATYDVIFFWQIMLHPTDLKKFKTKNIILIPMYDNDLTITYSMWREFNEYKFILFSKSLYKKLKFLGNKNLLYMQYAIKSNKKYINKSKKKNVFFWQRKVYMDFEYLKQIIDFSQVDSIHIHMMQDEYKKPSEKDIKKYNITFSNWFQTKDEYYDKLKQSNIFIAPRFYEGIGMGFLEAMAMGKCVIAANLPTMNEYIQDGYNGLLFDPVRPIKIDLTDFIKIGKNAKESMKYLYEKWNYNKNDLYSFIKKKRKKEKITQLNLDGKLSFLQDDLNIVHIKTTQRKIFNNYLNTLYIFLKDFIKENPKVIIYGFGTGAKVILNSIQKEVIFIVDQDTNKHNQKYLGIEIKSIKSLYKNSYPILISVFNRADLIKEELIKKYNISKDRIITLDINGYGF